MCGISAYCCRWFADSQSISQKSAQDLANSPSARLSCFIYFMEECWGGSGPRLVVPSTRQLNYLHSHAKYQSEEPSACCDCVLEVNSILPRIPTCFQGCRRLRQPLRVCSVHPWSVLLTRQQWPSGPNCSAPCTRGRLPKRTFEECVFGTLGGRKKKIYPANEKADSSEKRETEKYVWRSTILVKKIHKNIRT